MESNKKILNIDKNNTNNNQTNPAENQAQSITINEEEDEELDQSYGNEKVKQTKRSNVNDISENENYDDFDENGDINENIQNDEENYEYEEDDNDFIDFNKQNAYDSENSQDNNSDNQEEQEEQEEQEVIAKKEDILQNEKEEIVMQENQTDQKDQKDNELINDIENSKPREEAEGEAQISNQIKSNILAKKVTANSQKNKNNQKKKLKNADNKSKKFFEDRRETKTIFSKISEELFYKLSKDKFQKTSAYDFMTNDIYINRVVQKGDQENKNKFLNFVERNNEFFNKKKLRLNEKIQKISEETNSSLYAVPNKKVFSKQELRNPEQFYEDQKNFMLQKQQNIEVQREEVIKKNELEANNYIPEINKNSRNIVDKKIGPEKTEVFLRLHNQRTNKNKQQFFEGLADTKKNQTDIIYKNKKMPLVENLVENGKIKRNLIKENRTSLKTKTSVANIPNDKIIHNNNDNIKKRNSQIQDHSAKLHEDAKKWLIRNNERIKKFYNNETRDVQCKQTKILNVELFLKIFERALRKIIKMKFSQKELGNDEQVNYEDQKENQLDPNKLKLDFCDYCFLLRILGFLKHDYDTIKNCLINDSSEELAEKSAEKKQLVKDLNEKLVNPEKKPKLIKQKIKKEAVLVKDSWNILVSHSQKTNHNSEYDSVHQKDILIFLCVIQGFLKGDTERVSEEDQKEIKEIKMNNWFSKNNKKEKHQNAKKKKFQSNAKSQEKNVIMKGNLKILKSRIVNPNNKTWESSDLLKKVSSNFLTDDENNIYKVEQMNSPADSTGEFNKFKRIKSKDSINKFLKKSMEATNNLDENCENKYRRKKSNNKDLLMNNNNDKELSIQTVKLFTNDNDIRQNNLLNNNYEKSKNKTSSVNKENQRSFSNKNKRNTGASEYKENIYLNTDINDHKNGNIEFNKNYSKKNEHINDLYLINKFFKFINLETYPYNRIIAKKIKAIFSPFLENLNEFYNYKKLHNIKDSDSEPDSCPESHAAYKTKPVVSNDKMKNEIYYKKYKERVINQLDNELTFKPELNTSENLSNLNNNISHKRKKLKMEDAYEYHRKKKESELMKLRLLKDQMEIKDCTFQPNINQTGKKLNNYNLNHLVDKLYKDGLAHIKEKAEIQKKHEEENLKKVLDPKVLTFKPSLGNLNENIFNNKNIEAYEVSKKNVERFERARIEKKIADIQKQTGITNLNQINNIDALLKENNYPSWKFILEKKNNKDTFDDASRFSKLGEKKRENHENILNTLTNSLNYTNPNSNYDQFINLDVNISDESSVKRLRVGFNDDPKIIVDEFAKIYDLSEEKKVKLIGLVEEKIRENKLLIRQGSKQSSSAKKNS